MNRLIFFLFLFLLSFNASAFKVTTQGTGELSWLTNGNACWRACFVGRNKAIKEMGRIAGGHCPAGYAVKKVASCETPAKDNSFLDHRSGWPVCKCTDTCSGEFVCNTSGQKPSFHVNAIEEWRKLRRAWRIQTHEVKTSQKVMRSIQQPKQLYAAVTKQAKISGLNIDAFVEAYSEGAIQEVYAPHPEFLLSEFMPELPILKQYIQAKKVGTNRVQLSGLMGSKVSEIFVFSKGQLIKAISLSGEGDFSAILEDECFEQNDEVEVVVNGVSQYLVIR